MRIAICHFRYGMLDGVSLEMGKWARALGRLGHEVVIIAGEDPTGMARIVPELSIPHAEAICRNAVVALRDYAPGGLREAIEREAGRIAGGLARLLEREGVELLIVENLWSLPFNPAASLGVLGAVEALSLPVIAHHHDFWWERDVYSPTCAEIEALLAGHFPPPYPRAVHVVINSLARAELRRRRGMEATVVPNVIDLDAPWGVDGFNADLREALGLSPDDIVFLQATRVVPRKGIELAIELVHRFQEEVLPSLRIPGKGRRAVLLLPNLIEDREYHGKLVRRAGELGVEALFVPDRFGPERRVERGRKIYSLWDAYAVADFVTYPSLYEGFGNQFLEAVAARLPLAVFEYPVFAADIAPLGFRYVSLGSEYRRDGEGLAAVPEGVIPRAAAEVGAILADPGLRDRMVEHNLALAREHFSLERLERDLARIVAEAAG
ncbi:MAG: glycosyltransferase family 4 protein [Caldiserica bacterium]|nr:glycosyltransferase family 4 protein [Caldisericota bacterium]